MAIGSEVGAIVVLLILVIAFFAFLYYFPIGLWIRTIAAGVPLGIIALVRMRLIGIPPSVIVTNYVRARKAGLNLTVDQMQSHYLAGGNVENVTLAMIAAQRAEIPLEWQRAAAIDLAGRNVLEALQTSVNPKVIETPIFQGVAQNGIQLNVKARITVRSNLDRYVGGAGEPTIIARVGEGVVSAVGAAIDHKEVLEYPDRISKAVLAKGLDAGTAFEIVSIDIADVDVGKNIGAELQTSQAEADRRIAQAKAAERQYAALAAEQEQKAETQAMRAKVVEAEATIPQAIAQAFRSGNLGVMDYYRLKNVQADTEMRSSIGASTEAPNEASQPPANPGHQVARRDARSRSDRLGRLVDRRRHQQHRLQHPQGLGSPAASRARPRHGAAPPGHRQGAGRHPSGPSSSPGAGGAASARPAPSPRPAPGRRLRLRRRPRRTDPQPAALAGGAGPRSSAHRLFAGRGDAVRGIIAAEILGSPRGLRDEPFWR